MLGHVEELLEDIPGLKKARISVATGGEDGALGREAFRAVDIMTGVKKEMARADHAKHGEESAERAAASGMGFATVGFFALPLPHSPMFLKPFSVICEALAFHVPDEAGQMQFREHSTVRHITALLPDYQPQ